MDSLAALHFQFPAAFLLLLPLAGLLYWQYRNRAKKEVIKLPYLDTRTFDNWRIWLFRLLPYLKVAALVLGIIGLARPQLALKQENVKAKGIDIMLVMDLSPSMLAEDFKPNRLEVSKKIAVDFAKKRQHDRLGLTVFAAEAYSKCPLTNDHEVFINFLNELECGNLLEGTAIGLGLATAVNRLKESTAKSKIVVLLTDGDNNAGFIQPLTAAEIAKEYGIRVYTIAIGTIGEAPMPVRKLSGGKYLFGMSPVIIDEKLLTEIADLTNGKYFRATDEANLQKIYDYIDRLEKTEIEVSTFKRYHESYFIFVLMSAILLVLYLFIRFFILRTIL